MTETTFREEDASTAMWCIEDVLDALIEVGNGTTDEVLHQKADVLFGLRYFLEHLFGEKADENYKHYWDENKKLEARQRESLEKAIGFHPFDKAFDVLQRSAEKGYDVMMQEAAHNGGYDMTLELHPITCGYNAELNDTCIVTAEGKTVHYHGDITGALNENFKLPIVPWIERVTPDMIVWPEDKQEGDHASE